MPVTARTPRVRLLLPLALAPLLLALLPAAAAAAPRQSITLPTASVAPSEALLTMDRTRRVSRATKIRRAKRIAVAQIGDPYRFGAAGPNAFDCSGLIYFATHQAGLKGVPRTSRDQARHMRRIKKSNLRPGDYMFFTSGGRVYHAGMFVGRRDGRAIILHAPSTGKRVHKTRVWTSRWFAATLRR